jgi:LPXTG-motif cell wall-anchored protein
MKIVISVVAALLALMGLVFFLQGIGILLGSYMTGQAQWALIGIVLMVIGGGVLYRNWRRR